jgi:hypothetical protein
VNKGDNSESTKSYICKLVNLALVDL